MPSFDGLMNQVAEVVGAGNQDITQENANVKGNEPQGVMALLAGTTAKEFAVERLLSEDVKQAYLDGYIHIHDLDYYASGTATCLQIPLGKVLKEGFSVHDAHHREPSGIGSAMALMSIIYQAHQNQQHGGQAMTAVDIDLAPYAEKTFNKYEKKHWTRGMTEDQARAAAKEDTLEDIKQACEAFVHNMNSMMSRGGGQVVFSSVNFGLGTGFWEREISRGLLNAMYTGLGDGAQPIFPIMIFQLKDGINTKEGDPNYDLFQLALKTTAKRFFPNYAFCDASFNSEHYDADKPETWVSYMGCRTRTMENVNGESRTMGRGNLSFTTVNLPLLAIESNDVDDFFYKLDVYVDLGIKQLLERLQYQCSKKGKNFSFIFGEKTMYGSEHVDLEDGVFKALIHGTLSLGFVGLAETLIALTGKHHGESEEVQRLGLRIVEFMKGKMDAARDQYGLNFGLLATPAESYAGKALRITRAKHGIIKGVTDRDYFTNSFHVPVYYDIDLFKKIEIEGIYHQYCLAGHISYVEVDGIPSHNIEAMEMIVLAARDNNMGYFAVNIPVDRCLECGHIGEIAEECPMCGNMDQARIKRIRRITGYLVGDMARWNSGKVAEEAQRVKHLRFR